MSSNKPQSSPDGPNHWPAIFLFFAAIGVPGSAAIAFADKISKNPWQAFALTLLYELVLVVLAFLRSVWQHLEEDLSKGTATWVNNLVQLRWFRYSSYYSYFLTLQYRGLSTQNIYTLELEHVFVDLSLDPKMPEDVSPSSLHVQVPKELLVKNHSVWTYLAAEVLKNQQIVILGAPGSGKTSLLKHLALILVNRKKKRALAYPLRRLYTLPFLLLLREHTKNIQENPLFSLENAIEEKLRLWRREVPKGWVNRQLSKGGCLVLLDGLDEVADINTRKLVGKWVENQMIAYGKNRFVITSRPFGYRDNALSGVMVLEAQPLTFEQIQHFVQNWYRTNAVMDSLKDDPEVRTKANTEAQDLLLRIQQTAALASLAVNPLLLTMIATIHRYGSPLPDKRVNLYAKICDVFLGKCDMEIVFTPEQCCIVLRFLAYEMMVRQCKTILASEAQKIIEEPLRLVCEQMALEEPLQFVDRQKITPKGFLLMIENMSGLLLEQEQGVYSFAHLTFQEYLAATFLRDQQQEAVLIAHIGESWWEETTRLYCAQTDATAIIIACLKQASSSVAHLIFALECYEEAAQVQPTVKSQIDKLLELGAEDVDVARRHVVAEVLLRRRLKGMMPIIGRVYQDISLVTHVEYQLFVDVQRDLGFDFQLDHWENVQFSLGQALLPVVGVRPSDSEAFCQWLMRRESGVWTYRLPRLEEYLPREVQMRPSWLPPRTWNVSIGYWCWEERKRSFVWIRLQAGDRDQSGKISLGLDTFVKPLNLDSSSSDDYVQVVLLARKTTEIYSYFSQYIDRALGLALDLARGLAPTRGRDLALDRAFDLALALALDFDRARRVPSHTNRLAYDLDLDRAYVCALDLVRALGLTHDRDLAYDLVRASADALQLVRVRTNVFWPIAKLLALLSVCMSFSVYFVPFISKEGIAAIQPTLNRGIDIYQKIEHLEKRIQGKEYACEGILIVKERKETS